VLRIKGSDKNPLSRKAAKTLAESVKQQSVKKENYEKKRNTIATLFSREGGENRTDRFGILSENNRKSKYVGARNEGDEVSQTREYDRNNLFEKESELLGMQKASKAVAYTLREMIKYAQAGMTTKELDEYGAKILSDFGANSAPHLTYGFPSWNCISVDNEFCHGIPSEKRILKEGDLINIDVSAELDGFWADNGASFVIGKDINQHQKLVDASKEIL